ncbi:MAG: NAD(P)-dependent oxidoreductase [Cytophagales bacterium]|nr:NAD(P)-dependent oxidoreductase [Cytophagales bacterium]
MKPFKKILLTGAAGSLGKVLRASLALHTEVLRLSDISSMGNAAAHEEIIPCDLGDKAATMALLQGVEAVVHMGGVATEHSFEQILDANIRGIFHLYEGARVHGVRRVVFASSNHAIGFHKQGEILDSDSPQRPDSYYGLSKAYGENMAQFYFNRYGIETVSIRIGSSFPEPQDARMLITWLSYRDLSELVRCSLVAPKVGHTIVYGASNNKHSWWDNSKAAHLGFVPKDNTEAWRTSREAMPALPASDPARIYQGGGYTKMGPFN